MSFHSALTMTCPHCGHNNSITTANLPMGTALGCSRCREEIATWRGANGFEPMTPEEIGPLDLDPTNELVPA